MNIEIEILYDDLTRQRCCIKKADQLPKVGVLAIILSSPDDNNPRVIIDGIGFRRLDQCSGYDHYYLLKYWDDGSWWYALEGRDLKNLVHFHKDSAKPFNPSSLRIEHPRYNCWNLIFEGQHIDNNKWATAVERFEEMH